MASAVIAAGPVSASGIILVGAYLPLTRPTAEPMKPGRSWLFMMLGGARGQHRWLGMARLIDVT
ncbi:hypothetical protein [Komagataeibacter saccharivorans]|uniref:hypothetical protein n=1 Tax=Komagataeibacter saccharivorans TaxID=265959 RepID=UPI000C8501D9|nr:hypothetical protein [Komagataeibacter saccharivorans]